MFSIFVIFFGLSGGYYLSAISPHWAPSSDSTEGKGKAARLFLVKDRKDDF